MEPLRAVAHYALDELLASGYIVDQSDDHIDDKLLIRWLPGDGT
jgi:hypothetical protein